MPIDAAGNGFQAVTLMNPETGQPVIPATGSLLDIDLQALKDGRLFTASTGFVSVAANNFLNVIFENPTGSGVDIILIARRFGSTAAAATTYGGINAPTEATFASPTTRTPGNSRSGGPAAKSQFRYNMASTRIDSSPATAAPAGGIVLAGGETTLEFRRLITPGNRFGNFMGGAGGGLAATAILTITFYWVEIPAGT